MADLIFMDLAIHAMYYTQTGDQQAGNEAYNLAIANLIALPFGALLGGSLELLMENLSAAVSDRIIITSLDDTGRAIAERMLGTGYSEEFVQNIIKRSGK